MPGSIAVGTNTGGSTGAMTDAAGDDIADFGAACAHRDGAGRARGHQQHRRHPRRQLDHLRSGSGRPVDRAASGTTVTNTASLAYRAHTIGKDQVFVGNAVSTPVTTLADLQVSKTSTPTSQVAGGAVTYTVTMTNNGPAAATNAVLADTLPDGLTFVSSAPPAGTSCAAAGQVVTCSTPSLANGATVRVPIVATISPAAAAGSVTNTVVVSSDSADDVAINNTAAAATQITTSADVSIRKSATPTAVNAGDQVSYQLVVNNAGPVHRDRVLVNDPIPAGQTLVSATSSAGTCTLTPTVSCAIGTLGPGVPGTDQAVITIVTRVDANVPPNASVTNTATVSSSTPDPNAANNSASADLAISSRCRHRRQQDRGHRPGGCRHRPDLLHRRQQQRAVRRAERHADRPGGDRSDRPVRQHHPGHLRRSPTGRSRCPFGAVAANGRVIVTVVAADVAADRAAGPLTNTASATSDSTPDPNPGNNSGSSTVAVTTSADLALTKTATPGTIVFGQPVSYSLTVRNNGPSQATGATISDPLPAGLTFAASPDGCTATAGTVTCPVGTIAAGATRTVSFTANTPAGGSGDVTNTATVSGTTSDPNPANNTASAISTTQAQADISLLKSTSANPIAGQQVSYTLTARTMARPPHPQCWITDTLPAGITAVSITATRRHLHPGHAALRAGHRPAQRSDLRRDDRRDRRRRRHRPVHQHCARVLHRRRSQPR